MYWIMLKHVVVGFMKLRLHQLTHQHNYCIQSLSQRIAFQNKEKHSICAHMADLAPPEDESSSCSVVIIKLTTPHPPAAHPSLSNNRVAGCWSLERCLKYQMLQLSSMCMRTPKCVSSTGVFLFHSPRLQVKLFSCLLDTWTSHQPLQSSISKTKLTLFPSLPPTINGFLCSDSLPPLS